MKNITKKDIKASVNNKKNKIKVIKNLRRIHLQVIHTKNKKNDMKMILAIRNNKIVTY